MSEAPATVLGGWSNFYVIIGSASASLTGLVFVVITLVAGRPGNTSRDAIGTFSTPTVVHFCAALMIAAFMAAPWRAVLHVAVVLVCVGIYGMLYASHVIRKTSRLSNYQAETDDWVWYAILPFIAYLIIAAAAVGLLIVPSWSMFALAGAALLLVFIGIRNAWDVVTYLAVEFAPSGPPPVAEDARPGS